ncbi:MAG: cell division protein FtsA [Anaerolineae bacterium]|nr:cell division protein FtsA [Anaerolineae bacterium]
MGELVVGIDVGTTKVCTIVGEVREEDIHVVGLGVEPSRGMQKGVVTDMNALTAAISSSVHKAERSSGYEIGRAFVSLAGSQISSINSRGVAGISGVRAVQAEDVERAIANARAIAIPHNREVLHVIPRTYSLDGNEGVRSPLGMHGFRLEVETHIITATTSTVQNLEKCVESTGVYVDRFILNPLASGDVVLTPNERQMGVMVVDIGGGTTDLAIFIEGTVWHTAVLPVAGWHISNDVAHGLRLPYDLAEAVKLQYGHADPRGLDSIESFSVQPFGEELPSKVLRRDLAYIIGARVEEIFELVLQEAKRSGYDGLLPAGVVLTGGSTLLPGMREVAARVMRLPVRVAHPEKITGMADSLRSPSFSTSVGLLRLGLAMDLEDRQRALSTRAGSRNGFSLGKTIGGLFRRFLPEDEQ